MAHLPQPVRQAADKRREEGNVQTGDGDQMADAGAIEQLPLLFGNCALVAYRQRGDHSRVALAFERAQYSRAYRLAGPGDVVARPRGERVNASIVIVGAHIARGAKVILKEPCLEVEAVRIDGTVGAFEPHREGPAFAGVDREECRLDARISVARPAVV